MTLLQIDATADNVIITGTREIMEKVFRIHYPLNCRECGGNIEAEIYDPRPQEGAVAANMALHSARGLNGRFAVYREKTLRSIEA